MTIAYTEKFSSFFGTYDGTWRTANLSGPPLLVPANAICEMIIANGNLAAEATVGVRQVGSALSRLIPIHESEGGGSTTCRMLVKADASSVIEYNADMSVTFFLVGYWTGVDWTETWATKTFVKGESGWVDWTLFGTESIPKGAVCHVIGANSAAAAISYLGARTHGSALDRRAPSGVTEAEAGGVATYCTFVKNNATDGIIEVNVTAYGTDAYYLDGYFDSTMDYQEIALANTTATTSWADWDITAYLDVDGRVTDIQMCNSNPAATNTLGSRIKGSTLDRFITINEAEDSAGEYLPLITQSDASGIVQKNGSAANGSINLIGYFKAGAAPPTTVNRAIKRVESRFRRSTSKFHSGTTQYRRIVAA